MEALRLWRRAVQPRLVGVNHLPSGPAVFVGNHTIYGFLDAAVLLEWMFHEQGVLLRSMGDHVHFQIPVWRELFLAAGVVDGNRDAADQLLAEGHSLLIFPGGAREVARRKGERYPLHWKQRTGFVRVAVKHGVPVVPVAMVGVDDAFDVAVDANDVTGSPLWPALQSLGFREEALMPIPGGLPRPERIYLRFMKPVRTARWRGQQDDDALVMALREEVRESVRRGIDELRVMQARDPDRNSVVAGGKKVLVRWLAQALAGSTPPAR